MAESSSTSTDVKVLLQSLVTVAIIVAAGYFGMTLLGPRLAEIQPQAEQQPTLQAYNPPQDTAGTAGSEDGGAVTEGTQDQGEALPPDGAQPSVQQAATMASRAGRPAGGEPGAGRGPSAMQTSVAMGTPMPEGSPPGGPLAGEAFGAENGAGARLTAIAEGTMAPPAIGAGSDGQPNIEARMTAIAQGTFVPQSLSPGQTPAAPQSVVAADATSPGNPGESSASGVSDLAQGGTASAAAATPSATAAISELASSAGAGTTLPAGERLFAVTRGAGAGLYDRPDGEMISELVVGSALVAMARSDDGLWALVQSNNNVGWTPLDQLVLFDAESLPVISELEGANDSLSVAELLTGTPSAMAADAGDAATPLQPQRTPVTGSAAPVVGEYIEPVLATVISQFARLNVRSGPGTDFDILVRANPGEEFIALARTPLNDWIQVALPDTEEGVGWVAADFVDLSDRIDTLPAARLGEGDAPPVDLPTPTPVANAVQSANPQQQSSEGSAVALDSEDTTQLPADALVAVDASPPDDASLRGEVASSYILRKGPGADFDVETEVDTLPEFVELERSDDNAWARIALLEPPGGVGWISTGELEHTASETPQEPSGSSDEEVVATNSGASTGEGSGEMQLEAEALDSSPSSATLPASTTTDSVPATVISEDALLRVRSGPGTDFDIVTRIAPGKEVAATARSALGNWVRIALDASDDQGWVASPFIELEAPIDTLPVAAAAQEAPADRMTADVVYSSSNTVGQESIGPPEFLPTVGAANIADTAADIGGTLVFEASNGGQIYGYDLDVGELWPITTGFDPAISPDGKLVAFTRDGGEHGLYLVDIAGDNERLLYSGGQRLASPKWSPDGGRIVFSRGDDAYECIPFGPGGCVPIDALGDRPLPDDVVPSMWVNYHLSVVDADGEDYHDLATLESARAPDWNDAGIVYQSLAGLQRTSDEPNATNQLIVNDYLKPYFHDPDWQPGGDLIVYQGKEASHWELFSVRADGSGVTALTRPKTALVDVLPSNAAPAWNPEGDAVVFLSNRTEDGEAGEWRLWVMQADGSNQRPLSINVPMKYTFGDEQIVSWGPSVR